MSAREFIIGARRQEEWGWLVIVDMFLTGAGSGLFFIGFMVTSIRHMLFGIIIVFIGSIVLTVHLMRPLQSWRVFLRPTTSWISRGAIGMLAFLIIGTLYTAFLAFGPGMGDYFTLWDAAAPTLLACVGFLAGASALFVLLYPGFLLYSMRSVALWRNALLPILFSISGLLCGLGFYYLIPSSVALSDSGKLFVFYFSIGLIILGFLVLSVLIFIKPMSVLIQNGWHENQMKLFRWYFMAILTTEIIIPIITLYMLLNDVVTSGLLFVAGVSLAVSSLLLRLYVVRSGFRISPI
jgi:formate-dependent nitrite reductase membrane component NrfD